MNVELLTAYRSALTTLGSTSVIELTNYNLNYTRHFFYASAIIEVPEANPTAYALQWAVNLWRAGEPVLSLPGRTGVYGSNSYLSRTWLNVFAPARFTLNEPHRADDLEIVLTASANNRWHLVLHPVYVEAAFDSLTFDWVNVYTPGPPEGETNDPETEWPADTWFILALKSMR